MAAYRILSEYVLDLMDKLSTVVEVHFFIIQTECYEYIPEHIGIVFWPVEQLYG